MLKYVGNGFMVGVPARDLSEDEVQTIQKDLMISRQRLIESGLYEWVEDEGLMTIKIERPAHENKIQRRESENKEA